MRWEIIKIIALVSLSFLFAVYKRKQFTLLFFVVQVFRFNLLKSDVEIRGGTYILDEHNWPIAVFVELTNLLLGVCPTFIFSFH
jgi:hypothetical protein